MGASAFVNVSHPSDMLDPGVRKAVRRHVMKDIGRGRRKRPRPTIVELKVRTPTLCPVQINTESDEHEPDVEDDKSLMLQKTDLHNPNFIHVPGAPYASGIFGLDLGEQELEIVHFMRAEADYKYRPFHATWIRIGLSDSTAFYLSLASTALFKDHMRGEMKLSYRDNPSSAKYYSKALKQLSARLQDAEDCKSAGVIATILGCLCHDTNAGNWERWAVHLQGLDRVSKLRGGFEGLENEIPLMAFWLDLVGSTVTDSLPRFSIPAGIEAASVSPRPAPLEDFLTSLASAHPELSWLSPLFRRMHSISDKINLNADSTDFWRNEIEAIHMLGPITHHLLFSRRLPDARNRNNDILATGEMVRLVLLMLISGLKKRFSLNSSDMPHLQTRFRGVLAQNLDQPHGPAARLKLWALITAASLEAPDVNLDLVAAIRQLIQIQCLPDSTSAIRLSKQLIWIEGLHFYGDVELATQLDEYIMTLNILSTKRDKI